MKKGLAVLETAVTEMTQQLTEGDNVPDGFTMVPASIPDIEFDPFTEEAMIKAGFTPDTKPIPEGFFLLSQPYTDYLAGLREAQFEHPANTDGLPWAGESSHVIEMPTLEPEDASQPLNTQTNPTHIKG